MDTNTNLVKSKSSNSAITSKSKQSDNKKSASSAQFRQNTSKKRGVYVEKRNTITNLNGPEVNTLQEKPRAPPRPPPGQKRFLASVLSILSKSTTGTQYPENENGTQSTRRENKGKGRNEANINPRQKKYRSKILGNRDSQEQVVVLKQQQDMVQTPSMFSENSNTIMINKVGNDELDVIDNRIVKEVAEGKLYKKEKKVRIEDEPRTQVAVNANKKSTNDGKLYNFFVDLLQTTIIDYNVSTNYDGKSLSETSSTKLPLEIDEVVAEKLDIKSEEEKNPSNHFFCLRDDQEIMDMRDSASTSKRPKVSKKKKAKSFSLMRKPPPKSLKAESMISNQKKNTKKEKRRKLLNMFKEELRMDDDAFREPQNLYQALKAIAHNKRICQKTIHFEERNGRKKNGSIECRFKAQKVLSPIKKKKVKKSEPVFVKSEKENGSLNNSYHSLEVYGYDYETPVRSLRSYSSPVKEFALAKHSSSSVTDGMNSIIDFLNDSTSSFNSPSLKSWLK